MLFVLKDGVEEITMSLSFKIETHGKNRGSGKFVVSFERLLWKSFKDAS